MNVNFYLYLDGKVRINSVKIIYTLFKVSDVWLFCDEPSTVIRLRLADRRLRMPQHRDFVQIFNVLGFVFFIVIIIENPVFCYTLTLY